MRHHLKTEYRQYKGDEDMAYITVNNKNNTSNKTPPTEYSSWLDFWEENKGKKSSKTYNFNINMLSQGIMAQFIIWQSQS